MVVVVAAAAAASLTFPAALTAFWVFAALAAALTIVAASAAFPAFPASAKRPTSNKGEAGEAEAGISQPNRSQEGGQPDR
jgi:hypothetical protein